MTLSLPAFVAHTASSFLTSFPQPSHSRSPCLHLLVEAFSISRCMLLCSVLPLPIPLSLLLLDMGSPVDGVSNVGIQ